jgi:hypothetical protein
MLSGGCRTDRLISMRSINRCDEDSVHAGMVQALIVIVIAKTSVRLDAELRAEPLCSLLLVACKGNQLAFFSMAEGRQDRIFCDKTQADYRVSDRS